MSDALENLTMPPQSITILGSTGSIGQSTLDVLALHRDRFSVYALSANSSAELLLQQCLQWQPQFAVLRDDSRAQWLTAQLREAGSQTELLVGEQGLAAIASDDAVDTVMAAIVGAAGLSATLAAVNAGKKVLLANKEALVMAGALFMQAVQRSGAVLLPIDSEHNAIFQCLPGHVDFSGTASREGAGLAAFGVEKILLTGSGGPFRTLPMDQFSKVTPEQACAHPNWSMGKKISVDSATMMNKGLELIEACWLFDCAAEKVEIVVHPQSVIHSMVEYSDGSVLAQLGQPDMRTPIAHALAWPGRIASGVVRLNWAAMGQLDFEAPDDQRFPALRLAREAASAAGAAPVILNAANEVAVEAFLAGKVGFLSIAQTVADCLQQLSVKVAEPNSLEAIQTIDEETRALARELCQRHARSAVAG